MQEVLDVPNEVAAELAGIGDGVLGALRERLGCAINLRGNRLTLDGDDAKVVEAKAVLEELVDLVEGGQEIGAGTVDTILNAIDQAEDVREIFEDVVWSHRGKRITPKTVTQKHYVDAIRKRTVTFGIGPAGTGKTYLAIALAVAALSDRQVGRIILTRPAVEAGERLGFLPGDVLAKVDPYMRPLFDALYDTMDPEKLNAFIERGTIEVAPLAFMRGRTLNDSFIILDEAQNTSPEQMQMFLTRLGFGSKVVVTGDVTQIDLPREQASGLIQVQDILGSIDGIEFVQLRPRGRRAAQARAADRRGVQAALGGDRDGTPQVIEIEVDNRSGVDDRRGRARASSRARVLAAEGVDAGELGLVFVGPGREPRAEAGAPRHRRGDRRARVPDRRARRAARRPAAAARRRRHVPAGRRRGVARAARARGAASRRLRPRRRDGSARGAATGEHHATRRARRSPPPAPGRAPSLIDSFNYAFEGIIHVLRTQRNLRIHFAIAIGVIAAAAALGVERIELIALLLAIAFVLVAEMVNSAIEGAIDVSTTSFDPNAKLAKDVAAGAVLIASVTALARRLSRLRARGRAPHGARPRPRARRARGDHARGARARDPHRDRDEGVDRAAARRCAAAFRRATRRSRSRAGWRRPT